MAKQKQAKAPVAHIESSPAAQDAASSASVRPSVDGAVAEFSWEAPAAKQDDAVQQDQSAAAQTDTATAKDKPAAKKPKTTTTKAKVSVATDESAPSAETGKRSQASADQPADQPQKPAGRGGWRSPLSWVGQTFPGHEHAVLGGVAGLVIALLVFLIGIGKTLLVCLAVLVGVTIGQFLDGDPQIWHFIERLLADSRDEGE